MASSVKMGIRTLGTAATLAAALALAGCGGGAGGGDLPLLKVKLTVKSVSQGGVCETVPVRITPKALSAGEANKYANDKMIVTEVAMTGPTDENGAPMCNGEAETLPLAPGVWEFRAPLPSDMVTCEHDVQGTGELQVTLIDGMQGCSHPGGTHPDPTKPADGAPAADAAAAPADAAAPVDGAAPAPAN